MTVNTFILNDLQMDYLLFGLSKKSDIFNGATRSCKYFRHDPLRYIHFKIFNLKNLDRDWIRNRDILAMVYIDEALFLRDDMNHNRDGKYVFTMNHRDQYMVKKLINSKNKRDKEQRLDKVQRILQSNIRYSLRKL
jgi:hypothetical protein